MEAPLRPARAAPLLEPALPPLAVREAAQPEPRPPLKKSKQ